MKTLKPLLLFCILISFSCSEIEQNELENETPSTDLFRNDSVNSLAANNLNFATYLNNELIIQYKHNISSAALNDFRISHGIYHPNYIVKQNDPPKQGEYEICDLCSENAIIELWSLNPVIDVEIMAVTISDDDDSDSENLINNMSRNLSFTLENDTTPTFGTVDYRNYIDKIVTSNSGTTIAVIDSGLNPNFPVFNGQPFLFNASTDPIVSTLPEFSSVISGWDFVNSDNDPFDDNILQHGSAVTGTLKTDLDKYGTNYQIIPLKICNKLGKATLFNKICAINAAGNMGAEVVNISAGFYKPTTSTSSSATAASLTNNAILIDLIQQFNDVIFVASAGNANNNNDNEQIHYPSSINEDNILAIGAALFPKQVDEFIDIASFSNHGINSVDFIARGVKVPFIDVGGNLHQLAGTSFATPKVAAVATNILNNHNLMPLQTINKISTEYATHIPIIHVDRQVKFHQYVND